MEPKNLLSKISFWIFCSIMLIFFTYGLLFPIQSDYWIVKNGIPILFLEFFSFWSVMLLCLLIDWVKLRWFTLIFIIALFAMIFAFMYLYSLWFFVYFIISNIVKFFAFRTIKGSNIMDKVFKPQLPSIISYIFSLFIGKFLSLYLVDFFKEQIFLLSQYQTGLFENIGGTGFVDIPVFAFWGISYFLMLLIVSSILDYLNLRNFRIILH